MRRIVHIGILLTGMLFAIDSSGQQSTETMESLTAHLTGGTKRSWTMKAWRSMLGPDPHCLQGEIWTFSHDGRGVKKTCESGMAREREFAWALVGTEDDRPVVQIDETQYIAELRQKKATGEGARPVLVTILRPPRTSSSSPVDEITLNFRDEPGKGEAPGEEPAVTASRIFAGPNQYPPAEFAAYGILVFRSRSSPYDRDRHLMFCSAYLATLPPASELVIGRAMQMIPHAKQMVTVWPLDSIDDSNRLNQLLSPLKDICQIAVDKYNIVTAQQALKEAKHAGVDTTGTGPLLLAWSPSRDKGKQDALVLVSDLSDVTTYEQAREVFLAWSDDIERDPTLWSNGWDLERLRKHIRHWVDKYGAKSLEVFGVKG